MEHSRRAPNRALGDGAQLSVQEFAVFLEPHVQKVDPSLRPGLFLDTFGVGLDCP